MKVNDFYNILERLKKDSVSNEKEYLKLLKVIGNNQRYDFTSQLSIYGKNPDAIACAKYKYWDEHFGRIATHGQKGIPILEDHGTYKNIDYIFDISQTASKNKDVNEVTKLKMLEANYKSNRYRLEDKITKDYPVEIARREKLIEAVKNDIARIEPKADGEEKFTSIIIAGEKITDKKLAGEKLIEAIKTVKIDESKVIGRYRNLDIEAGYDPLINEYKFSLNGNAKHALELGTNPDGNIIRLDNAIEKIPDKLKHLEAKLEGTKERFESAKKELEKPFEQADILKEKVLRLSELNKLLDMGDAEETQESDPLIENVKRAVIDFCNREYEENHSYDEFDTLYPDIRHIGVAYTNTPDEKHSIQYEINLEGKTWTQYIDDVPIKTESFDYENKGESEALRNMQNEIERSSFNDLVRVDSEDLEAAIGDVSVEKKQREEEEFLM